MVRNTEGTSNEQLRALVLRTCAPDMSSYDGAFTWPSSGPVECPDWKPEPVCGGGLHGLLWGEGDCVTIDRSPDAKWLVVEVEASAVVPLDDGRKCKFPRGAVVYAGTHAGAVEYLLAHGGAAKAIWGARIDAGDSGTATAGDSGTATAGDGGTATAGNRGTATAGFSGTATAGYSGTATAGYSGTATAGEGGTATAGEGGTATAGEGGIIQIRRWDGKAERWRLITGYVGEGGIEPGVAYRLDGENFVVARPDCVEVQS